MISENACQCQRCVGCDKRGFTTKEFAGVYRVVCRRCNLEKCIAANPVEEVPLMGGQGSGRPKSHKDVPKRKHTVTLSDLVWDRLEVQAGGERKVSELLEELLTAYVAVLDAKKI